LIPRYSIGRMGRPRPRRPIEVRLQWPQLRIIDNTRRHVSSSRLSAASLAAWALVELGLLPSSARCSCHHPRRNNCRSRSRRSCIRHSGPTRSVRSRSSCIGNQRPAVRSRSRRCQPGSRRRIVRRRQSARPATKDGVASRASLLRGNRGRSSAASTGPRAAAYHPSQHRPRPVLAIRKTERKTPNVTAVVAINRRYQSATAKA
jgi:hypothetical protein